MSRVALVTGAGSGIGAATARALAAAGLSVLATDIDPRGLPPLEAAGAVTLLHDTTDPAAWAAAVATAEARFGRLDILCNIAGIGRPGDVESHDDAAWEQVLSVNLDGVFLGCRAALPALRRAGSGVILGIASLAAFRGFPEAAAYGVAKAAVTQLSRSLAVHCARRGDAIRVLTLHPGPVMTRLMERQLRHAPDPQAVRRRWTADNPSGRFGTAEEVAAAIVHLTRPDLPWLTGTAIVLDGGQMAV